jgi:glycosyltransferase involved in cell wall biosynthesis
LRILILSFYFQPDLSAGSFRTTAFVEALEAAIGPDDRIEVLTTLPNRYHSFSQEAPEEEARGRVRIRRIRLFEHRSGMIDQTRAFTLFAYNVRRYVDRRPFDVIYSTSSRLFTGFLGALCAKRTGAALYLDIRDIFTDTISSILRSPMVRVLMPILRRIERYTIRTANHVNLVSEGFREYFELHYPGKNYSFLSNGIDDEFLRTDFRHEPRNDDKQIILYAGNIGEGQGLHRIVPGMAKALGNKYEFWVVGDGGRKGVLREALEREQVANVKLMVPVSRARLLELYRQCDYVFLHLNDYDAFQKVLPSKIFEYAATGKPVLAGVAGHSAEFLGKYVDNAAVFPPCDIAGGVKALASLRPTECRRDGFIGAHQRSRIMRQLAQDVLELGRWHFKNERFSRQDKLET